MKTALVAGSTGLIGSQLLQLLLASERYSKVFAITRKSLPEHPKLIQITKEMGDSASYSAIRANDVFCCLGTTIAKAGSKENFRKVDFLYPFVLANAMHKEGATQYLLVSSLGANKESSIFYSRIKGEVEQAVTGVGYEAVHIFRPSLLVGNRDEKRTGEDAAKIFYKLFGFMIPAKYKSIDSVKVARAMLYYSTLEHKGTFIHESEALQVF